MISQRMMTVSRAIELPVSLRRREALSFLPPRSNQVFSVRPYVRQLDWCSKDKGEQKARKKWSPVLRQEDKDSKRFRYPSKIGIIAAVSNNYVIGVNGHLPWRIEEDFNYFRQITRNRIIVLGRISFEETPNQSHLKHAQHVIVVSPSYMKNKDKVRSIQEQSMATVHVASCLDTALQQAYELSNDFSSESKNDLVSANPAQVSPAGRTAEHVTNDNTRFNFDHKHVTTDIDCWVAGGEKLFEQALIHPAIHELRLTRVHLDVDEKQYTTNNDNTIAKFPASYRWDYRFKEISTWKGSSKGISKTNGSGDVDYNFHVYHCYRPR